MLSDSISDRTIALLLLYNSYIHCADGYVAAKLMCRLICNLPELSIRIFSIRLLPIFLLIGMNFGSKILILYAVG